MPGCRRETCARCGAPNPDWGTLLLVKPARRPRWWPKNGSGTAAWATIHWDGKWVLGYSIGIDHGRAFHRRQLDAAKRRWNEEYDSRKWTFKEIPSEIFHD